MYFSQVLYGFPNVDAYARTSEEMDGTLTKIQFLKFRDGGLQIHPGAGWGQMVWT